MSIRPLQDRIVIERVEEDQTTAGGIVLPDTAKERPSRGKVIAIGNGKKLESGQQQPLDVKIGDIVLFGKYAGTEVKLNDKEYLVMREDDVMGVIDA